MEIWKKIVIALTILIILYPLAILLMWSVSEHWMYPSLLPTELDFSNYATLFNTYNLGKVIMNSIIISAVVVLVSMIMGLLPSKFLGTKKFRGKTAAQVVMMMPIMAPSIVILFGLINVFVKLGINRTYLSLVIAEVIFFIPYAIMVLVPVFKNYDVGIENQAATLGVGKLSTLMNITLPSVRTGLVVSAMYVFMASWATYLAVSMYAPVGFDTVASLLYPAISNGQYSNDLLASLTVLFFVPSLIFLFISTWIMGTDRVNNRGV